MIMNGENHQSRSRCCFNRWMKLQEEDLDELLQALNLNDIGNDQNDIDGNVDDQEDDKYNELAEKAIKHFQDYVDQRSRLAHESASLFFAPGWCTSIENSALWIGGCRPSSFIRLTYALAGSEVENLIDELMATEDGGNIGKKKREITGNQLAMINTLQLKTVKEEDKITGKLAEVQDNMVDHPLCTVAKSSRSVGQASMEVDHALDSHERAMADIMKEADNLRLMTLKELIGILTPMQAVDFLAASKKLHLCIHAWGKQRDQNHGRTSDLR